MVMLSTMAVSHNFEGTEMLGSIAKLLFFLILLVLREKKIRNLIKYAVVMVVPLMIEVLPNIGNIYFKRNVLGFGVLKFVQKPFTIGFFDGINLVAVTAAFMLVWAYQKKTKDNREMFSWGIFFCVGMSFAIFGFSSWNPQWLLMLVPFLVLNIFMNENGICFSFSRNWESAFRKYLRWKVELKNNENK